MTPAGLIAIVCLAVTGALCTWAVFSKHFDDSLMQRTGLALVACSCILRIPMKWADPYTPPEIMIALLGVCLYAIGTALKLWLSQRGFHRRERRGKAAHQ